MRRSDERAVDRLDLCATARDEVEEGTDVHRVDAPPWQHHRCVDRRNPASAPVRPLQWS